MLFSVLNLISVSDVLVDNLLLDVARKSGIDVAEKPFGVHSALAVGSNNDRPPVVVMREIMVEGCLDVCVSHVHGGLKGAGVTLKEGVPQRLEILRRLAHLAIPRRKYSGDPLKWQGSILLRDRVLSTPGQVAC